MLIICPVFCYETALIWNNLAPKWKKYILWKHWVKINKNIFQLQEVFQPKLNRVVLLLLFALLIDHFIMLSVLWGYPLISLPYFSGWFRVRLLKWFLGLLKVLYDFKKFKSHRSFDIYALLFLLNMQYVLKNDKSD